MFFGGMMSIICKICNKTFDGFLGLGNHISKTEKMSIKEYYDKYMNEDNHGVCECGKTTKFISLNKGYSKFCSLKCSNSSNSTKNKKKQTYIEKYGVDHISKLDEIKEKKRNSSIIKYGTDCPLQNDDIKQKIKTTNLHKYGTLYTNQNEDVRLKIHNTNILKYGCKSPLGCKAIKDKIRQILIDKYGVKNPMNNKDIYNKSIITNNLKYGCDSPLQNKLIYFKQRQTLKNRYGHEHPLQVPEIKNKYCSDRLFSFFNYLLTSDRLNNICKPNFNIEEYNGVYTEHEWICNKCNNVFKDKLEFGRIPRCLKCYPKNAGTSKYEKEIYDFCSVYFNDVELNNRSILDGKEIDVYIPSIKLGIEFNGLYWHRETTEITPNYHLNKTNLAKSKGVQLIHIFEDEWIEKQDIVKSVLLSKMNKLPNRIQARKCFIKQILNEEASRFLLDNHLQGFINGTHYGLIYDNEIVSLLTVGKSRFDNKYEYEIYRFCSKINYSVVGALGKLFKHFLSENKPKSIITYADRRYGEGLAYTNLGFNYLYNTNPGYTYFDINGSNQRYNRMNFQKHALKDKLKVFNEELTEYQNMQLNGYDRIWDCGNNVYGMEK